MSIFKIALYDTIERGGEALVDMAINSRVTALSWTSTLPAGCNTLSVGILDPELRAGYSTSYAYIPEPIETKAFAHVVVTVGTIPVWEGRLVEDEIGPLGVQGFIADGYGLAGSNNDYFESTDTAATTTGAIIGDILAQAATLLSKGVGDEWTDPGVTHTRAEFNGATLAEALNQVLAEGGAGYVTWDWFVTLGRRLALVPRIAPETPDYLIPFRAGETTIRRNFRDIASSAVVSYTAGGVNAITAAETRDATAIEWRVNRRVLISGDELTATGAAQLRSMELERRSKPAVSVSVTRGPNDSQWLTTPGGIGIPHWAVHAGQWVQVADMEPQIIVNCSFDPTRGLSIDLGAPSRLSFATYLAATCAEVTKLTRSINPKTGGRRRAITATTDTGLPTFSTVADAQTWARALRTNLQATKVMS